MKYRVVFLSFLLALVSSHPQSLLGKQKSSKSRSSGSTTNTRFEFRNVNFRIDDSVVMEIRLLRGELLPAFRDTPPNFDDRRTLIMKIDGGEAAMSTASFTDLMNRYVFNYPGAPLTAIRVSTKGNQLRQEARLHKGAHTEMIGSLDALPDGRIRFHPTSIKTAGVPTKKLMDLVGLKVDKLVKGTDPRGVTIVGDDMILDLELILPPPKVQARVTRVRIEGDRIIQTFGPKSRGDTAKDLTPPDSKAANYMYYRGGTIRFRKQIMVDADMQVVDNHPQDPFDFSLTRYYDQLVAGYTKNTPGAAMISFVPDYHRLRGPIAPPGVPPAPGSSGPAPGGQPGRQQKR
jgi:hypothetical protein